MSAIRAVFFDADGTLFHSPEEVFAGALRELGRPRPVAEVRAAYEQARPWYRENLERYRGRLDEFWVTFNRLVLRALGEADDAPLAAGVHEVFDRVERTVLHDDVHGTLEALRGEGFRLGVISNRAMEPLRTMLRATGIDGFFSAFAAMDDYHAFKPDARLFRLALDRAGCAARESVHVGDLYSEDVVGAQAVGMRAVLLQREDGEVPPGDYVRVRTLSEVPGVVRGGFHATA